jgi:hypothetical protein
VRSQVGSPRGYDLSRFVDQKKKAVSSSGRSSRDIFSKLRPYEIAPPIFHEIVSNIPGGSIYDEPIDGCNIFSKCASSSLYVFFGVGSLNRNEAAEQKEMGCSIEDGRESHACEANDGQGLSTYGQRTLLRQSSLAIATVDLDWSSRLEVLVCLFTRRSSPYNLSP